MNKRLFAMLTLLAVFTLVGCSPTPPGAAPESREIPGMRVAIQFSLGNAPLVVLREKGFIERYLPGVEVEWEQYGSGAAMGEALIAGELDVGMMGIPPFLIGWDKGAGWKVASGIVVFSLGLQTHRDDIQTLADFGEGDKIAVPAPGSGQHILLSMAAEEELGDPTALDDLIVAMANPDAAAALLSKTDIDAHFAPPPYSFTELEDPDIHQIELSETESNNLAVATEEFYKGNPQGYSAFVLGLTEAISFINQNPEEAAAILAPAFELDEETMLEHLTGPGVNHTTTPYGLLGWGPFMEESGYIDRAPAELSEMAFSNVQAAVGHAFGDEPSPIEELQHRQ